MRAFGVDDDDALRMLGPECGDVLGPEPLVDRAVTRHSNRVASLQSASVSPPSSRRGSQRRMSSSE